VDDAVLSVVRESFRESTPIRFEGNNYSESGWWRPRAADCPISRARQIALAQLVTDSSRKLFNALGILTSEELESRYHVRLERYSKDVLIEFHVLREMVDTMVLPAAYQYLGVLARAAADAKTAGLGSVPQAAAAEELGAMVEELRTRRATLESALERAESIADPQEHATFLSRQRVESLGAVRELCDRLELSVPDEMWPLPKYREMLFPV
jgi:glutamine synthetase